MGGGLDGTGLWANASTLDGVNGVNGCYPAEVALDTNGFVWNTYGPSSGKTCTASIYGRSATAGGAATYTFTAAAPYGVQGQATPIAFDRYNNLWAARLTSSGTNMMFEYPFAGAAGTYQNTSTVAAAVSLNGTTAGGTMVNPFDILIDNNSNLYVTSFGTSVTGAIYGVRI